MKIHIVQANETLESIAHKYQIHVDDIIKNNLHISHAKNIMPGMKLKLPILAEPAQEKLRENTISIEEYYPTLENFNKEQMANQTTEIPKETPKPVYTPPQNQMPYQYPYGMQYHQAQYPYGYPMWGMPTMPYNQPYYQNPYSMPVQSPQNFQMPPTYSYPQSPPDYLRLAPLKKTEEVPEQKIEPIKIDLRKPKVEG